MTPHTTRFGEEIIVMFRVSFEYFVISAIDECTAGTDLCLTATGARCVDKDVLYACECNTGFLLNPDKISCRGMTFQSVR